MWTCHIKNTNKNNPPCYYWWIFGLFLNILEYMHTTNNVDINHIGFLRLLQVSLNNWVAYYHTVLKAISRATLLLKSLGESFLAFSHLVDWHSLACRCIITVTWPSSPCVYSYDLPSVHVCLCAQISWFIRTLVILDWAYPTDITLTWLPVQRPYFQINTTFWVILGVRSSTFCF